MQLGLLDTWGRLVVAEVRLVGDNVEVWCKNLLRGAGSRQFLAAWLREPEGVYTYDDVTWLPVPYGIALGIENLVPLWPLADSAVADLRAAV